MISSNRDTIGRWRCIWTDHKVVIITVKKLGIRLNIVHFISNTFKASLTISFLVVEDKKWLVISIITENSGQTKGKTWLVKSVDRLFRPLDNESEVSPEKKRNRVLNSFTSKVPVTKTSERRFLLSKCTYTLFCKQRIFSTQSQCCLTFSRIKPQMLLKCCLLWSYRDMLNFVYLCPCLLLGLLIIWSIFQYSFHFQCNYLILLK